MSMHAMYLGQTSRLTVAWSLLAPWESFVINISVCLSVCMYVCPLTYLKNCMSKFHEVFCMCFLISVVLNMLCTYGFVDDVMFSHNGVASFR